MQTATVYCAWCKIHLRGDPRIARGQISHGICATCADNIISGIAPAHRTPGPACQEDRNERQTHEAQ